MQVNETSSMETCGVLFIVNSLRFGGAEKHVVSLLNHMDDKRFRLSLAYLKPEENLLSQIDVTRLQAVFCSMVSRRVDIRAVRELGQHIDRAAIDLVVCTNTYSMLYGALACRIAERRPKLVEVFHTTLLQSVSDKLQMAFYWPVFRCCDMLVYVCENQRRYWHGKGLSARAEAMIYNGIDTDHFTDNSIPEQKQQLRSQYGFVQDDFVIGICAALRPEKAHTDLLVAVKNLAGNGTPVKCLIIGEGAERPHIEQQIKLLGLDDRVAITGFQPDVRPFVAACDAMALVSHAVETFSISALESMALGKPIVMSDIGGAAEQVQDGINGYLYPARDIAALTDALAKLAHPGHRATLGTRAGEMVRERFSLMSMVHAFEDLFQRVVDRK